MARKGENIYLRKDGRWEGRYIRGRRPDGKAIFCSIYGKQYGEVKRRLILLKAQVCREPDAVRTYGGGTLREWGDFWLEVMMRPHIKQSTWEGYQRMLKNHIYPGLGDEQLSQISGERIQELVNSLQDTLAPSTLSGVCRLLKTLLQSAFSRKLMAQNPYQEIRVPKARKTVPRVLTRREQIRLEEKINDTEELEYLLCLYTGLRVGELCALKWEDIDFENESIQVRHSVQRLAAEEGEKKTKLILGTPKTETSLREIPLPGFLVTLLKEKRDAVSPGSQEFLFPGRGGGCRDPRTMQQHLGRIMQELKIPGVHMHTLRHTFATRCLEQNMGMEILSELLGHSSPQITLKHYAHCTREKKRQSMACIERLLDQPAE